MIGLRPCDGETLALYRARATEFVRLADEIGSPSFSKTLRADLFKILGDTESVRVVEALTRLGEFGDVERYRSQRANVRAILNRKGIRLPKGKRPLHPGLDPLVSRLAPVLLALGVPRATGEYSLLVEALRAIAGEIGVTGDPRDMLRRAGRLGRQLEEHACRELLDAFARGIEPDPE